VLFVALLISTTNAVAQHPITIQRDAAAGEYFRALVNFEKLPKRTVTNDARGAMARSAWALGLTDRALTEYDRLLREGKLSGPEQSRVLLARSVIHLQEGRAALSATDAERAIAFLPLPSALRARAYRVWGDALVANGMLGSAIGKYERALSECAEADRTELNLSLGTVLRKLGKLDDARHFLEQVPLNTEYTADAIRMLAEVALAQGRPIDAALWLRRGRADYPDTFLDSWVEYVFLRGAMEQNDRAAVRAARDEAVTRYPPSDYWRTIVEAAAEAFEWQSLMAPVASGPIQSAETP
jgi:tetratricopeptide (TPR) repeat protein